MKRLNTHARHLPCSLSVKKYTQYKIQLSQYKYMDLIENNLRF